MSRQAPHWRADYLHNLIIPTRWADADRYGHINNSIYYFYFDTVVNRWLIENDLLDLNEPDPIGLVVETGCTFFAPLDFPEDIIAGLRVAHIGNSSVRYEIALFSDSGATPDLAKAQGHFVHVYVNATTRRPVALSKAMTRQLETLS